MDLHIVTQSILPPQWASREYPEDRVVREYDSLEVGPLTGDLTGFRGMRLAFLRASGQLCDEVTPDWWDEPLAATLEGIDRVCVWMTTHMRDQLAMAYVAARLRSIEFPGDHVDIVHTGNRGESIQLFRQRIETDRAEQEPLPRRAVSASEWEALDALWCAVTSPMPTDLPAALALLSDDALIPGRTALLALLGHYPDRHTGLSVYQERLLRGVAQRQGPRPSTKAACALGQAAAATHTFADDLLFDTMMFQLALALGDPALPRPLLEVTVHGQELMIATRSFGITDFGREVLAGRASFLDHNPIDRWVAGVHLDSASDRVWVRDGETIVPWTRS